jgi:PHD/YefM family antitoxin component YafN of YafNO toxin-antitoxin module
MHIWNISEAKARLPEVIQQGKKEPQIILNYDQPVAAVIGIEEFIRFEKYQQETRRRSIAEFLADIQMICLQEGDLDFMPRKDRPAAGSEN